MSHNPSFELRRRLTFRLSIFCVKTAIKQAKIHHFYCLIFIVFRCYALIFMRFICTFSFARQNSPDVAPHDAHY